MQGPSLEIALFNVGNRTLDDELTDDGVMWHGLFKRLTQVPGFIRGGWGRMTHDPSTNIFLVDWESYEHHERFMDEKGDFTPPLMSILTGDFDMYHINPNTESREFMNAPVTTLTFFLQPHKENFESALQVFFDTTRATEGCRGITWGEAMRPPRRDPSGLLRDGRGFIMIAGWETPEHLERAMRNESILEITKKVEDRVAKVIQYAATLRVTEKSEYEHSWRRL